MTSRIILLLCMYSLAFSSCAQKNNKVPAKSESDPITLAPQDDESMATFASGCFWCAEEIFESILGVREVISGYAGGPEKNPTYEQVSSGRTGHAESVQVYYDTTIITFDRLVEAFFDGHDPTTMNQQGPDIGRQYRSVAFYRNEKEKEIILHEIQERNQSGIYDDPIVTEVEPFTTFYPAENYHQDYIANNPNNPYVRGVSKPRFEKFKKKYEGKLKEE